MSKALGAAFLNHQVEQLEKSVSNGPNGNWRDRRYHISQAQDHTRAANNNRRTPGNGALRTAVKPTQKGNEKLDSVQDRGKKEDGGADKDADIVILDASVLIHALPNVKKWCRDGRQEVVIVPLEALNTLDLLKKGTSSLAQRARAASRILEAQVGTNPRIRVQRDDAFVFWDKIPFQDDATPNVVASPEWVRRTISCARWELEHAIPEGTHPDKKPKVVLAVLSSPPDNPSEISTTADTISASPVPLPAPQPNRHEPRSAGTLVTHWAAKAGLELLQVSQAPASGASPAPGMNKDLHALGAGRRSPEDDRIPRGPVGRGRRNSHQRSDARAPTPGGGGGLVERPPAVMAMMEMVSQPSRVVRVLARGEKLDPN
ncbi:hypothetical protein PHLCEN_2v5500 [Hermanssonia centrifuga]|uniref:PIN domain-containing protein n=1 Tax=Hermanssonia centrifuga TaxID=98765 RepID=A0A2R6P2A7_9APHY|nr:hypothetical protein PHLCEN_2v5500 [Hermanssonia centrifuga]